MIREKKTHSIFSAIQTGQHLGMISLDMFLFELWAHRKISYEEMLRVAEKPDELEEKARVLITQAQAKGGKVSPQDIQAALAAGGRPAPPHPEGGPAGQTQRPGGH
jgi:Tfp pilus assembly ATPase PilU